MFWNAPIWLNELFINTVKICINLFYLGIFIAVIYFAYSYVFFLINKKRTRKNL